MPQWLSFLGSAPRRPDVSTASEPSLGCGRSDGARPGLRMWALPAWSEHSRCCRQARRHARRRGDSVDPRSEETPCPTRPHHHEPSWRARVNGGGGTGETDGPRRVRTDPEGSQESDRLHRQRQRGSRGGNTGCKAGRPVLEARRKSDSNGRAGARDSDRRARRVLSRPRSAARRPPGDVAEVRFDPSVTVRVGARFGPVRRDAAGTSVAGT